MDHQALTALLSRAGFIAADEEASELLARADGDPDVLAALVDRRLTGEPLAWITGTVTFCGLTIRVDPGVYVPRWHTEIVAQTAGERLPDAGTAIDICTGSGAIAAVLAARHPDARVVGTDIDGASVACAATNGVEVYGGDLFAELPAELRGNVDVVVAVVPYVPTSELPLLQRDTFTFETPLAYDGGPDGTGVLQRVIAGSARYLRGGGALVLELGGEQASALADDLAARGFVDVRELIDDDGDTRGVEATFRPGTRAPAPAPGRPKGQPWQSGHMRRKLT